LIEHGEELTSVLWLGVTIVSLVPLSFFLVSYLRVGTRRLLLTTAAFALFFVKALVLAMKLFIPSYSDEVWWAVAAILDMVIIGMIAVSLSGKGPNA
jgi:hypothetical protein